MGQPSRIPPPGLPAHPTLRPGFRVARRDEHHLQVGVDPPRRVVLPDVAAIRDLLEDLRDARCPVLRDDEARRALDALVRADLVVPHHASRLESAQFGDGAADRLARRHRARVEVLDAGAHACASWADDLAALVRGRGVRTRRGATSTSEAPDLAVVLGTGQPPRDLLDDLVRDGTAYLLLVADANGVEIGPLVRPGLSACHRCVDARRSEDDPRRTLVCEQIARQIAECEDEPMDPVLMHLAAAWAVRDVVRHLEGDRVDTDSASYLITPSGPPVARRWPPHAHCGCSWVELESLLA